MSHILILLASTLFLAQSPEPAPSPAEIDRSGLSAPHTPATFSRQPKLGVSVRATDGTRIPGATLELCKHNGDTAPDTGPLKDRACRVGISDQHGQAVFDELPAGDYRLTVLLEGFIDTHIGPMSINGDDPIAPDDIVAMLNPECYHCVAGSP